MNSNINSKKDTLKKEEMSFKATFYNQGKFHIRLGKFFNKCTPTMLNFLPVEFFNFGPPSS